MATNFEQGLEWLKSSADNLTDALESFKRSMDEDPAPIEKGAFAQVITTMTDMQDVITQLHAHLEESAK